MSNANKGAITRPIPAAGLDGVSLGSLNGAERSVADTKSDSFMVGAATMLAWISRISRRISSREVRGSSRKSLPSTRRSANQASTRDEVAHGDMDQQTLKRRVTHCTLRRQGQCQ
jgi:hypothetical protein